MANAIYNTLITDWNTSTAAPISSTITGVTGVAGQSLNGLTTAQKIAAVNAWTVTGTSPTAFPITGAQIISLVEWSELAALTDAQRKDILGLCQIPGSMTGGSAETALVVDGMFIAYFGSNSQSIANLTEFATAQIQLWVNVSVANGGSGLFFQITQTDVTNAGLS
jgi:hypothetical protein